MNKHELFRQCIAAYLIDIQDECERLNVPMDYFTLIARDATNDEMSIVTSNDPDLKYACDLALKLDGQPPPEAPQ